MLPAVSISIVFCRRHISLSGGNMVVFPPPFSSLLFLFFPPLVVLGQIFLRYDLN